MVYARTTVFDMYAVHSQLKISYVSPLFRDCLKGMWPMDIDIWSKPEGLAVRP